MSFVCFIFLFHCCFYKLNPQYWQFVQRAPVDFAITEPLSANEAPPVIEAIWEVSEWSTCSHSCAGGKKGSDSCFLAYFRWSWRWKRRRHARPTKPHPRYLSTSRHCLKNLSEQWILISVVSLRYFSQGVQTRSVECVVKEDKSYLSDAVCIRDSRKPATERQCNTQKCNPL